ILALPDVAAGDRRAHRRENRPGTLFQSTAAGAARVARRAGLYCVAADTDDPAGGAARAAGDVREGRTGFCPLVSAAGDVGLLLAELCVLPLSVAVDPGG